MENETMSSKNPLVSIIIPTRNRKELLLDAVRSALAQTYQDIQIVVHDNNSSDGTGEYLNKNISDSRLEYYRVTEDLSMTDNWNKAFSLAKGEYLLRLDDDNVIANDLVESALDEIKQHSLDAVNFSQHIVQLGGRVERLFEFEKKTFIVNKFQLIYLEYFALIDSNYTVYKVSTLRKLFPKGDCYQTTLPDRYMDYRICDHMDAQGIRFGVRPVPKGITRFDYRPAVPAGFSLKYIDYGQIKLTDVLALKDCQFNFSMHRIITLSYFLSDNKDPELRDYCNRALTSPKLYSTMMRVGHAFTGGSLRTAKEIPLFIRYIVVSLADFLRFPKERMEAKGIYRNLGSTIKNGLLVVARLVFGNHSKVSIDLTLGNKLTQSVINGDTPEIHQMNSGFGAFYKTLEKAEELRKFVCTAPFPAQARET